MEFSDIALAKFTQTAPDLAPYIVTFSEISNDSAGQDEATKIGVFILKVGIGHVTVPVISRSDSVFPIDSVFVEADKKFRPLTQATIRYLVSSSDMKLGGKSTIPDSAIKNPDLTNLITPPRTGKFSYASASRLVEFLAVLPPDVKKFAFEKIASEQSVYHTLDKLFGLKAIFAALNGDLGGTGAKNSVASGPAPLRVNTYSVLTTPNEVATLMDDYLSKSFIEKNYVVVGGSDTNRTAVAYQNFNDAGVFTVINPATEGGREYAVSMKDGTSRSAYLPMYHKLNPVSGVDDLASILDNGNYVRGSLITHGDAMEGLEIFSTLFKLRPPKLLKDLERDEKFIMFTSSGEALGPLTADYVTRTAHGVEIKVYGAYGSIRRINGFNNYTREVDVVGDALFVPHNIIVFVLGQDVTSDAEVSVNAASHKKEIFTSQLLGAQLDVRHDGVEFSLNGRPVGGFPHAMKALVEHEQIDPTSAENFLKQAQQTKFVKLFLSKAAATSDYNPSEIPQYGSPVPPAPEVGINGSFMPALQGATGLGDAQAMEATIIAQLLQVPELFEYISEYLPDIDETVDKLGRILLLSRIKIDQLADALDSDSVFSLVAQIKSVYRQLGDASLKLQNISSSAVGYNKEEVIGQTNGR